MVDDDPPSLGVCVDLLKELGYEAEGVTKAKVAIERLGDGHWDMLFTDVVMPDMNGKEVLRAVKQRFPTIDVIVMTGFPKIADAIVTLKMGAYDYLMKPITKDMLELTVRRCLEKRELQMGRNFEYMLRRRVEVLQDQVRGAEKDRKKVMDEHGEPLLKILKETQGHVERLEQQGLAAAQQGILVEVRSRLRQVSDHIRALLEVLTKTG